MVLSQRLADESPLALLRLRRAEADEALRRSLGTASMLALTTCVALLLVRALFYAPPALREIVIDWRPPINNPQPPPSDPRAPQPPSGGTVKTPNGVQPVDHVDPQVKVPDIPSTGGQEGDSVVPGGRAVSVGSGTAPIEQPDPSPTDGIYIEELPNPVFKVTPEYPAIAREAGMEGRVIVRLLLDLDGRVKRAEIEKSSPMFDEQALAAARLWKFTPAKTDGHPVKAWVRIPFDFRLH